MPSSTLPLLGLLGLGNTELIVICILALVLFGARLPKAARSFGMSIKEFKKGIKESGDGEEDPTQARPTQIENRDARKVETATRDREGHA